MLRWKIGSYQTEIARTGGMAVDKPFEQTHIEYTRSPVLHLDEKAINACENTAVIAMARTLAAHKRFSRSHWSGQPSVVPHMEPYRSSQTGVFMS